MIDIKVNYSIDYEIQRVKYTISKIDWYKKSGYKPLLPENLSLENKDSFNEDDIKRLVTSEYKEEDYKKIEAFIKKEWLIIGPILHKNLLRLSLTPEKVYEIYLTKYGVGGSYNLPNKIITNIRLKYDVGLIKTIAHEIVHLSIQPFIDQYKVEHWKKERIVDLILSKIIPKINKMQVVPIDTKSTDESFSRYYPDIKAVIKNL